MEPPFFMSRKRMNDQKPMKMDRSIDGLLLVHSIFHTIQGEGPFVGFPSVFIRLGGCNLQCPGCDTEYTKGAVRGSIDWVINVVRDRFHEFGTQTGLHAVASHRRPLVVITGGEPFRQDIWPLIRLLVGNGFTVQIETNGTLFQKPPIGSIRAYELTYVYIVCSPKTGKIQPEMVQFISALKYVGKAGNICNLDGLPILALDHPASPQLARPPKGFSGPVYLQPMDEKDEVRNNKNLQAVVEACKKFGHTLCLQTHKIIGEE